MSVEDLDPFTGESTIDSADGDEPTSLAVFEGDIGELALEVRQCLVVLLKRTLISQEHNPREWNTLTQHTELVRSRLHDLFLDLTVNKDKAVAFKTQVRSDVPGQFPPLLRETTYTREETILLVVLRRRHLAEAVGDVPVRIDRQELVDAVASYRPPHATDQAGDEKKANAAIRNLHQDKILVAGDQDAPRFIISPVIESLLPLDQLKVLLQWLKDQKDAGPDDDTSAEDEDQLQLDSEDD